MLGLRVSRFGGVLLAPGMSNVRSFEGLKEKLTTSPILAYAVSKLFILEVDTSYQGLGAVLSQEQEGKVRPIAYASHSLRPTKYV